MSKIRLEPGTYEAIAPCRVYLMLDNATAASEIEFREYKAGERFEVPRHALRHWSGLAYFPEYDGPEPPARKAN